MSDATTFIDLLKRSDIHEAIGVIKESLSERAKGKIAEVKFEIAEAFKMSKKEDKDEDEDDDDKDDDKDDSAKDDVNKDDPAKKDDDDKKDD